MVEPAVVSRESTLVIVRAGNPGPMTLDGTRTYLVGEKRLAVIDPGPADRAHVALVEREVGGREVVGLLLTHSHGDHSGAAAELARLLGAPILASSSTLERGGLSGRAVADGDEIPLDSGIGLAVVESPGHSSDHLTFFLQPQRWLFSGDLVLGAGSSAILHPDGSVGACIASLSRLISLRPTRLLPGHGDPSDHAPERLAEYRRHRRERGRQVEEAVRGGASSVLEIRNTVYGALPPGLSWAADASIAAHLAAPREEGMDVPDFDDYGVAGEEG